MNHHYDYIICGGGCAGLSLAHRLAAPEFAHLRILLIERDSKTTNDRTWSFWHKGLHDYEEIVAHRWSSIAVHDSDSLQYLPLDSYQYQSIRGIDFYDFCIQKIKKCEHITWLQDEVLSIQDGESLATVITSGPTPLTADYVFDSIVRQYPTDGLFTWQHFRGWIVEAQDEVFDTDTATFMDFRIDQGGETRFIYILPYTKNTALIEATVFGSSLYTHDVYDEMIKQYISKHLSIESYTIKEIEEGKIPMTTSSFSNAHPQRVMPIGARAGTVKPSTGYAFLRIQEESQQLVSSILSGQKLSPIKKSAKYIAYDRTLLNVLLTGKEQGRQIFTRLFERNKTAIILKFLDEKTSIVEELKIFSTLPFLSFLRAFWVENIWKPLSDQ